MTAAIVAEGLSKKYLISHQREEPYLALRDALARGVGNCLKAPFRPWLKRSADPTREEFWALSDVGFEIQQGDRVGIVGRNGAGKSTLLKILSRIVEPTGGRFSIRGRVASLLEVGTGFHAELTGRENIYLNGALLGMRKAEIRRKFDEIVQFAEVERFLDTPVKRYSSGMYVRLAFSVAAHLEPDILIVDEVLAVGDITFQKKCLGKMESVTGGGRTLLFVSHNMSTVASLCNRSIFLNNGRIAMDGPTDAVINEYFAFLDTACDLSERADRKGTGDVRVTRISIRDQEGNPLNAVAPGQTIDICLAFANTSGQELRGIRSMITIHNRQGQPIFSQHNQLSDSDYGVLPKAGEFVCTIPRLPLNSAFYKLSYTISGFGESIIHDQLADAIEFKVAGSGFFPKARAPNNTYGQTLVDAHWRIGELADESGNSTAPTPA